MTRALPAERDRILVELPRDTLIEFVVRCWLGPAQHPASPTAVGDEPVRCAEATPRQMAAVEAEPAAWKRGLATLSMPARGRERRSQIDPQ
jgi:hypothetical protein